MEVYHFVNVVGHDNLRLTIQLAIKDLHMMRIYILFSRFRDLIIRTFKSQGISKLLIVASSDYKSEKFETDWMRFIPSSPEITNSLTKDFILSNVYTDERGMK